MVHSRTARVATIVLALALVGALAVGLAGCGPEEAAETSTPSGTARAGLDVARSALETMAPDAKLLVVQTAQAATPADVPVWAYLFGSPSTDLTYLVYVTNGTVMTASEYGTAGLDADEWELVPGVEDWVVDSDQAYQSALDVSGASGDPNAYYMGLQTYLPRAMEASATGEAFIWYVYFDPGASGATTSTIQVDAATGEASLAEGQ